MLIFWVVEDHHFQSLEFFVLLFMKNLFSPSSLLVEFSRDDWQRMKTSHIFVVLLNIMQYAIAIVIILLKFFRIIQSFIQRLLILVGSCQCYFQNILGINCCVNGNTKDVMERVISVQNKLFVRKDLFCTSIFFSMGTRRIIPAKLRGFEKHHTYKYNTK